MTIEATAVLFATMTFGLGVLVGIVCGLLMGGAML